MKKRILLWIAAAIVLLAIPVTAVLLSGMNQTVDAYDPSSGLTGKPVPDGGGYSFLLDLAAPFEGVSVTLTEFGTGRGEAEVSLRRFTDSVDATLDTEAIAGETASFSGEVDVSLRFGRQDAGAYLVTVEKRGGSVGVLAADDNSVALTDCYAGNTDVADFDIRMSVTFSAASDSWFAASASLTDSLNLTDSKYTVKPGTWVFTDALGRVSLTNEDVGDPRDDKTLTMFFWDWHINDGALNRMSKVPVNVQKLMDAHPEIQNDYNSSLWGAAASHSYYWNESIYGYYASNDTWVVRKQGELLANAGVDAIFFDNTNGSFTWSNAYTPILNTFLQMKSEGVNVPKASFVLPLAANSDSVTQVTSLYNSAYSNASWSELWYRMDGKPFLMAHSSNLGTIYKNYFSFRAGHDTYTAGTSVTKGSAYWGWLTVYPQPVFGTGTSLTQMTVSPAQNYTYRNTANSSYPIIAMNGKYVMGRSWTHADGGSAYDANGNLKDPNSSLYGYNFAEQFEYALSKNPDVIMVTGWNEWCADRQTVWPDGSGYNQTVNALPDTFNDEYSRDIEPSKGKLKDNYYYQLVNYIRTYKGTEAIEPAGAAKYIDIFGDISEWNSVGPYFAAYRNNTGNRNASGMGGYYYTENSGRNDIIGAQISRDDSYVYFLVECMDDITSYTGGRWMTLYLDTDQTNQGWETFDYVINKTAPTATTAYVERFTGNGYETETVGTVAYSVDGRYLQIKVPKSYLGLSGYDFTINFTWTDNVHDEGNYSAFSGDIMNFYISGDVAPGGRFKYSYVSTSDRALTGLDDYDKLTIAGWYEKDFSSIVGLRGTQTVDMTGLAADLGATGWTRTALLYIPESTYAPDAEISVFAFRGEDAGSWLAGVNYNLSTGTVSTTNPSLFSRVSATPAPASGWVHFAETFDGRTQKVYINGELAFTATASSLTAGKTALSAAGQNTMLLGGHVTYGTPDASAVSQYQNYGVILWRCAGYKTATTADGIAALFCNLRIGMNGDPTDITYAYDKIISSPWYAYDYTVTENGTLQNTTKTALSVKDCAADMDSWTKIVRYDIPDTAFTSGSSILVFGIKSTAATGAADIETGVEYDLGTGLAAFSNASNFKVTYSKAKPVTGKAYFLGTFTGGILRVWLNGEMILSGTATRDLSADLSADSQNQIFLNVYAAYGAKRTSFKSQFTAYGVSMDYAFGYLHAASPAAAARFYAASVAGGDSNYGEVMSKPWYAFSYAEGLGGMTSVSLPETVSSSGTLTGWTHEVVYYIPEISYAAGDFIGILEPYRTDDGYWNAGIRYQPGTGLVSSTNTGLFPLKTRTQNAVPATGFVHFVETFDGVTQKVYVNGVLAYTATSNGVLDVLNADRATSLLLGGYAPAGKPVAGATDVFVAYGARLMCVNAYAVPADGTAAARLFCTYLENFVKPAFAKQITAVQVTRPVFDTDPGYASVMGNATYSLNQAASGGLTKAFSGNTGMPSKVTNNSYTKVSAFYIPEAQYASGDTLAIAALGDITGTSDRDLSVSYQLSTGEIRPLSSHFSVTYSNPVKATGYVQFVEVFSGSGTGMKIDVYVNGTLAATLKVVSASVQNESYFKYGMYTYLFFGTKADCSTDAYKTYGIKAQYVYIWRDAIASSAQVQRLYEKMNTGKAVTIYVDEDGNEVDPPST